MFPTKDFPQRTIFGGYEKEYLKIKNAENTENRETSLNKSLEQNKDVPDTSGKPSGTPENSDEKNLNNVETPGQAKLNAARLMLESLGVTPEQLNSKNNGGEQVPLGQTNNPAGTPSLDDLKNPTEAERFKKYVDLMIPTEHSTLSSACLYCSSLTNNFFSNE